MYTHTPHMSVNLQVDKPPSMISWCLYMHTSVSLVQARSVFPSGSYFWLGSTSSI